MLSRAKLVACRCASTSTAAPCRHGVREFSRYATIETTRNGSEATRDGGAAALDYAAPLWGSSAPTDSQWFYAARPAWTDWKRNSPPSPATYAPSPVSPTKPPHLDESRPSDHPAPSGLSPSSSLPDSAEVRVSAYLRSRGQRSALHEFRDEYGQVLDVAERADMPLLRAMVLEDQELAGVSHRGLKVLEIERFATNRPKEGGEVAHAVRTSAGSLQQLGHPDSPTSATTQGRRRRRSRSNVVAAPTPSPEIAPLLAAQPELDAAPRLVAYSGGASEDLASLALDWRAFSDTADLETSDKDLHIALDFLLQLSHPTAHLASHSPSASLPPSTTQLQLALRVLQRLLDVFPEDVVQPEPTRVDLPQPIRLQVVLVRTLLEIALREELTDLASRALHAMAALRNIHPALADSPESSFDILAVGKVLQRSLVTLREERQTSYPPALRSDAWSSSSEISRAAALLRLRYRFSSSRQVDPAESLSRTVHQHLSSFADECASRRRWDLIAECWRLWSKRGWQVGRHALPLARWLAGASSPDMYGRGALAVPAVNPRLFSVLANEVATTLHSGRIGLDWTAEAKNDWVDLLCASRAASRATRQTARRLVTLWQQRQPVGSATPFVLRGSTLLNLLRTALPPYANEHDYPRQVLSAHVATLVNPASPYASKNGRIEHYDLTTLAQAFTLAGDHASVGQIYRRALEQRHLPDAKDVGVVLADVARRFPDGAFEQLARAAASGLKVDLELVQAVLTVRLDQLRHTASHGAAVDEKMRLQDAISDACALAGRLGFAEHQVVALRRFGENHLAADIAASVKPSRYGTGDEMSAGRAIGDLLKASCIGDWRLAHRVFTRTLIRDELGRTVAHGICDERLLTLCLETLLKADRSKGYRAERPAIRDAIAQVLAAAVAPLAQLGGGATPIPAGNVTLIRSRAGLDLVLEAYIRTTTDPDATDAVMALVDRQSYLECAEPLLLSDATKEKVVRWAVATRGRDVLLSQVGFLGSAAREVLNQQKGTAAMPEERGRHTLLA
ncbi:hypothetical protein JCM10908_006705 [Rhodotorula pacifica]|uniref:uncharacterized protein n=1 Tax=Rhodotorula pacifica TaxID=1495444 RepID=UPI003179EA4A